MHLEDSDGKITKEATKDEILATLKRIGGDLEHCILTYSDKAGSEFFIQAAGSGSGLFVQYNELAGQFQSARSDFDPETVCRMFLAAASGDSGWKREFDFEPLEGGGSVPTGGDAAVSRHESYGQSGPSFKDQILSSAKREAGYGIAGIIRRIIRLVFGRRF